MKGMPKPGKGGKGQLPMNMDPAAMAKMLPPHMLQQVAAAPASLLRSAPVLVQAGGRRRRVLVLEAIYYIYIIYIINLLIFRCLGL